MINHTTRRLMFTFVIALALLNAGAAVAQTTAFTYQGRLTDGGNPADGSYDLTFKLFDTATVGGGTQQGATLSLTSVAVSGGVFTARLDFGACAGCFDGAGRFLEIAVRPSGGGSFTTLSPRQPITSTPYAVKSVSAATADGLSLSCVSCVTSAQIQSVQGSQVTGSIAGGQISGAIPLASVPAGSASYIQNGTGQQASSNFNISGDGTAGGTLSGNVVNATTRISLGGFPILRISGPGNDSLGVGRFAGVGGEGNTFVGFEAGSAGFPEANNNTFVGKNAGIFPIFHGSGNTLLGADTKLGSSLNSISNATAIGAGALVDQSNSLVLGNGVNVGIGTTSPQYKLHVVGQDVRVESTQGSFPRFSLNYASAPTDTGKWQNYAAESRLIFSALNGAENAENIWLRVNRLAGTNIVTNVEFPTSFVRINQLAGGGSNSICRDSTNQLALCSSSIRYKTNIADWRGGLSLINRLRPVTFDWKESRAHDLGLVAEEVAEAEPLLVTRNQKGEIEGVKYDRLNVVLINAVKEQQAQIKSQADALAALQTRLASLERAMRQPRHHRRTKSAGKGR